MNKTSRVLVLLALCLLVSACTSSAPEPVTPLYPDNTNNSIIMPSEGTGLAPVNEQPADNSMKSIEQQENLLGEYSQALIKTNLGDIRVEFYGSDAPLTVNNFLNLAKEGFFEGIKFHRVIKGFMIQGGDPLTKGSDVNLYGTGGPGYKFQDEFNANKLVAGSLAMANSGPATNGSQFFIVTAEETPWLDGRHTNFGRVVSGMDTVMKIEAVETGVNDRPLSDVVIESVELIK